MTQITANTFYCVLTHLELCEHIWIVSKTYLDIDYAYLHSVQAHLLSKNTYIQCLKTFRQYYPHRFTRNFKNLLIHCSGGIHSSDSSEENMIFNHSGEDLTIGDNLAHSEDKFQSLLPPVKQYSCSRGVVLTF